MMYCNPGKHTDHYTTDTVKYILNMTPQFKINIMLLFLKINLYAMNEELFTKQRKINGYDCSIREIWSVVCQNILIPSIIFYFPTPSRFSWITVHHRFYSQSVVLDCSTS
jgi:hypothetical protein